MNELLIDDLLDRGVENIISDRDSLRELLMSGKKLNCYLGIDPTATRIHLGHAFPLRKLQQMVDLGHNVTFLIGSYTALVGDTSDKNDERPMLTLEQIEENFKEYKEQASKFLDFDKVTLAHNGEWLSQLSFKDVLELAGNFSVNDFTSRELIRGRLDAGKRVSLPETLYPLMQGYDSYHMDTDIQFGGTDQTFNMQAGRTLIKRMRNKDSFIVANGFLPGTDGRKMSKSWGNAIWMNDPANEVFGKVMRVSDDVMRNYFEYATSVPLDKVDQLLQQNADQPMELKKILAREVVKELCGESAIAAAEEHFIATVQNKQATADVVTVSVEHDLSHSKLIDIMIEQKMVESKSEARRLFEQGAIRLDDKPLNLDTTITLQDSQLLRVGKRRYLKITKQ